MNWKVLAQLMGTQQVNWQLAFDRVNLCDLAYSDAASPIGRGHCIVGRDGAGLDYSTVVCFRGTSSIPMLCTLIRKEKDTGSDVFAW